MSEQRPSGDTDRGGDSAAERAGIVDQQDAVLHEMDRADGEPGDAERPAPPRIVDATDDIYD